MLTGEDRAVRRLELTAPRTLDVVRVPAREPRPHEVLCAVEVAGVCGTDLHLWAGRDPLPAGHVLGHDATARVVARGADADTGIPDGARVVIDPVDGCRRCVACRDGQRHLCHDTTYMGLNVDGCFQELLAVPADRVHRLPDDLDQDSGALLEPVAVGIHVLDRLRPILREGHAVVVGCGPIGVVIGAMLAQEGFEWFGVDPRADRRLLAERWGAVLTASPEEHDRVRQRLSPGTTAIVDCSGAAQAPRWCIEQAPPGSVIVVVAGSHAGYPSAPVLRKELTLLGIRGGLRYPDAVTLAAGGSLPLAELVTDRRRLSEAADGFRTMAHGGPGRHRLHLYFRGHEGGTSHAP